MAATGLSYCAQQVRRFDHDRYLTCLFAPAARREQLFALYAFNLEVAKTAELVSEAMLGRVRLQWWREALEGIYTARTAGHEVLEPLVEAVRRHGLSRVHFDRLIDAREFDLDGAAPETLAALEHYAEGTSASRVLLALEVLGAQGPAAAAAGRHVGIAFALAGLLRAVPFDAGRKRLYLPQDLVRKSGLRIGELFELRSSAALNRIAEAIAARASRHLSEARALSAQVPKAAAPALLPAVLAGQGLKALRKSGYDPFDAAVQERPSRPRLACARLRGTC
ncbi:MAG: phytoene/squalene synthase family protein [Kiloniellaceae bacterium]